MLEGYHATAAHLARISPMVMLALYHHLVPADHAAGAPLSFRLFPFMAELYREGHKLEDVVAQKCTQVGWTEWVLAFVAMQAAVRGRRAAYVMPHDGMLRTFVQDRFQPMIERSPYYRRVSQQGVQERDKQADNLRIRQLGIGTVRFLGSRTAANWREFATDAIIIDEFDECDQRHLGKARDRIRASQFPQMIRMGNPTLPGKGISRLYRNSDRRRWFHRCGACGHRQAIDWFSHVVERDSSGRWQPRDRDRWRDLGSADIKPDPGQDIRPICARCSKPFDRIVRGDWVAEDRTKPRRGYHVSQMDVPGRPLAGLFAEWQEAQNDEDRLVAFYSGVLGQPYTPAGAKLTVEDLRGAMVEHALDYGGGEDYRERTVTCGVDIGAVLNVSVSVVEAQDVDDEGDEGGAGKGEPIRRAVWVGAVPRFEDLYDIFERYCVDVVVLDAAPELHKAQEVRDKVNARRDIPTRVYLCRYTQQPKVERQRYGLRLKSEVSEVHVHRTGLLDTTFADIRAGRRTFPHDVETVLGFSEQMRAPTRVLSKKGDRYVWDEGDRPDHYRHADAYDRVAYDLLNMGGGYIEIDLQDLGW